MLIQPAAVVRDLCLHLDSELSTKQHVNKVAAICYYHLRRLRQIRSEVTIRLVLALIMSRIDYCRTDRCLKLCLHRTRGVATC